ncbi:uncharacterized protein LOC128721574 [Anopheles nili]|uniref:uncharacterized protein LOC128721574 n=1 Tax=Anopheles nili TaxID=185578 RepID=UPI00237AD55D|nr:uncharacterized protein LOC128721574 [Anopheles nili]
MEQPPVLESRAKQIEKEYLSSLADLNVNSKPLINMLTILAEENLEYAQIIVNAVEKHLAKVTPDVKLPILYLVDSIVKNVGKQYQTLFSQVIVNMFCGVFQTVNEKIREKMFSLRQTWNEVFQQPKLYTLDVKINSIDPGWPITAQLKPKVAPTIHVNPMFLKTVEPAAAMQQKLRDKHRELLELQARKLELELLTTKKRIAEQEKQLSIQTASIAKESPSEFRKNLEPLPIAGPVTGSGLISTAVPPPGVNAKSRIAPVPQSMINMVKTRDPRLAKQQAAQLVGPSATMGITNANNQSTLGPMTLPPPVLAAGMMEAPAHGSSSSNQSFVHVKDRLGARPRRNETSSGGNSRADSAVEEGISRSKKTSSVSSSTSPHKSRHDHDTKSRKDRKDHSSSSSNSRTSGKSKTSSSPRNSAEKRKQRTQSNSDSSPQGRKSPHSPAKKKTSDKSSTHHSSNDNSKGSSKSRSEAKSISSEADRPLQMDNVTSDSKRIQRSTEEYQPATDNITAKNDEKNGTLVFEARSQKWIKIDETVPFDHAMQEEADKMIVTMVEQNSSEVQNNSATDDDEALSAMIAKDIDLRAIPLQLMPNNRIVDHEIPPNGLLAEQACSSSSSKEPPVKRFDNKDEDEFSGGKKRTSSSANCEEPVSKKSKAEMIDALFGNEDVDLRQLPMGATLMISGDGQNIDFPKIDNDVDVPRSPLSEKTNSNHGDSLRMKMVDGSKSQEKDKLGRPLLYNKLPDDPVERRRSINSLAKPGDVDLRAPQHNIHQDDNAIDLDDDNSMDSMNSNIKTIIAQAQDQMEKGEISLEQYNILMKQVIQLNETQKIRQAQRIEHVKRQDQMIIRIDDNGSMSGEDDVIVTSVTPGSSASGIRLNDQQGDSATGDANDFHGKINQMDGKPSAISKTFEAPFAALGVPSTSVPPPDIRPQRDPRRIRESKWNRVEPAWANRSGPGGPPVSGGPITAVPSLGGIRCGTGIPVPSPWEQAPFPVLIDNTQRFPGPAVLPMGVLSGPASNGQSMLISAVAKVNDSVRTINIDGIQREIRFYEETAVIFMNWDEPKEIGFQKGARMVAVDDRETFELGFNETYKSVSIDNKVYQMRLGAPTRELYIDDAWYECYFGEPPTTIILDGKPRVFKISGPAPQVKIGNCRKDLVAGKINMIIDAKYMIPVFLDCKVQMFEVYGHKHRLQFADFLLTVLIDDQPFPADYGGLPTLFRSRERDYYIRFTALPNLVVPGRVYVRDMIRTPLYRDLRTPPKDSSAIPTVPLMPFAPSATGPTGVLSSGPSNVGIGMLNNLPPGIVSLHPGIPANAGMTGLDYLTNLMPTMTMQTVTSSKNVPGYRIEADEKTLTGGSSVGLTTASSNAAASAGGMPLLANINVEELYKKIVAAGIITKLGAGTGTSSSPTPSSRIGTNSGGAASKESIDDASKSKEKDKTPMPEIEPVLLDKPETLKKRQAAVVHQLFSGMQCSSCGVRFPPEQTMKYSQHLDWHFRQNRRDRDSARKAHSRKWYYDVSDWIQYEEIEDLEEREKNWFETQQSDQGDLKKGGVGSGGLSGLGGDGEELSSHADSPQPSCPAGSDESDRQCHMCHDVFEQFYNEETEEWHLKNAIRIEGSTYHPLCYEDYKASLTMSESTINESRSINESLKTDITMDSMIESGEDGVGKGQRTEDAEVGNAAAPSEKGENMMEDDEDDDVIVLPTVEPMVEEILDDDTDDPPNGVKEVDETSYTDDESTIKAAKSPTGLRQPEFQERQIDEDLFIQEPNIEVTDLDEIEDKPAATPTSTGIGADDGEENSLSSLLRVKIKEEPQEEDDADEEDALFEDVGTIESSMIEIVDHRSPIVNNVEEELYDDVPSESIPSPTEASNQAVISMQPKASIDGNVELQEASQATIVVPNKIKINITKTKASAISGHQAASSHQGGASSMSECETNETNVAGNVNNFNEDSQGVGNDGGAVDQSDITFDELSNDGIGSWEEKDEKHGSEQSKNKETSAGTAATAAVVAVVAFEETTDVAYELKQGLVGVELNRQPRVTNGYEASGLCSIM